MGFRITTNMMMSSYRYNLMNSTNKLADARDKVLTHRNFNSYAEDPAAATQAFRLRRDYCQTDNQLTNTKDVYSKFNTAWHNVQGMLKDLINPMEKVSAIRGNNGTAGESRQALAQVLRESSESMIQGFNQKLGDHFIFAGNDALNVPFEWKGDQLYYRGINVNAGGLEDPAGRSAPDWGAIDPATNLPENMPAQGADDWEQAWIDYYKDNETGATPTGVPKPTDKPAGDLHNPPENAYERVWSAYNKDQEDFAKLKAMSEEEMYIDLGMGAKENGANNPIRGSYFNSALSGLNFTGYGVDEDGDPKNFAILMKELADVFDGWHESGQKYLPEAYRDMSADDLKALMDSDEDVEKEIEAYHEESEARALRLMDKLKIAQETLTAENVELDAQSSYLLTNQERLETQKTDINMEILDVEQVDLADAITSFSWDMYCYNAALKIGNQLLSQSLIDYMR